MDTKKHGGIGGLRAGLAWSILTMGLAIGLTMAGCANSPGPTGPEGPAGPAGPKGPAGAQGPAGTVPQSVIDFVDRFGAPNAAAAGTGATCTLGEVTLTAANVGRGMPAAGQLMPIAQNTALFSLLGTTYGGDGTTDFALPDMRGLAPPNMTYMICTSGVFPSKN